MFFEDRIKSIKKNDKVLEIGPGATPFWRSDVFLEKKYETKDEYIAQTGHVGELVTDKRVVYYDGWAFPFEDKAFDYVICSHVLEHVDDPDFFLKEIQRVGKMGYLEFPTVYYDYIYNFPEHPMLLNFDGQKINWMPKSESGFNTYKNVQSFFYRTCELEYFSLINDLKAYFFQGFEWTNTIASQRVQQLDQLCYDLSKIQIETPYAKGLAKTHAIDASLKGRVKNKLMDILRKW
jgi:SAM-dependent methyltransferase